MEISIKNKKFGNLKALSFSHKDKRGVMYWVFSCGCGNKKIIRKSHVVAGSTSSCGCFRFRKGFDFPTTTHNMSKTKFYRKFCKINERCYDKNNKDYKNWGGRGIKNEWNIFEDFYKDMYPSYLKYSKKFGEQNTTLDRIDVNGNYCKKNCRWLSIQDQQKNRRNAIKLSYKGKKYPISELAKILGLERYNIYSGYYRGLSLKETIKFYTK